MAAHNCNMMRPNLFIHKVRVSVLAGGVDTRTRLIFLFVNYVNFFFQYKFKFKS